VREVIMKLQKWMIVFTALLVAPEGLKSGWEMFHGFPEWLEGLQCGG